MIFFNIVLSPNWRWECLGWKWYIKIWDNKLRNGNQEHVLPQSKWQYKNPIDSRLLNYKKTNLRVTPLSSITTNLSFPLNLCPNPTQTRQQIDHKIVNNPPQKNSNIEELTGLNIVPPSKLRNKIIEPTSPNTNKQPNNNNQHKSKSKSPNNKEWETQNKPKLEPQQY